MRDEARTRRNLWIVLGGSIALLAIALVLLLTNVLPTRAKVRELEAKNRELAAEIESLEAEKERLSLEAWALEEDPQSQIRAYRRSFNTLLDGETIYRFDDEEEETPVVD